MFIPISLTNRYKMVSASTVSTKLSGIESWFFTCLEERYESMEEEEKEVYYVKYACDEFTNDLTSECEEFFDMSSGGISSELEDAIWSDVDFEKVCLAYLEYIKDEEFERFSSDKTTISLELYHKNQMVLDHQIKIVKNVLRSG